MIRSIGAAVVLALAVASPVQAQAPDSLIASGIRSYRNLEFDAAAGFLTRALSLLGPADTARRTEALTYLGATEVYRQRGDTAREIFRGVVKLAPAYRIDRLIFPPEVTVLFDAARRSTLAVAVRTDHEQEFRTGPRGFTGMLFTSTFHDVRAEIQRADASVVRSIYAGPVADSLAFDWDGRAADGMPLPTGRYQFAIASLDSAGTAARILRFPLDVLARVEDTLAVPAPPDAAQLLPERRASAGGTEALVGGLLAGLTVAILPATVASDASLSPGRYGVGGAMAVVGVVGYFLTRGAVGIPANVAHNDSVRAAWRTVRDSALAENARRRGFADMFVRVGAPQVIDREGS